MKPAIPRRIAILVAALMLSACMSAPYQDGIALIDQGRYEEGLTLLQKLSDDDPRDPQLRAAYVNQRERVIASQLAAAERARQDGRFDAAGMTYKQVLRIDSANSRAIDALRLIELQQGLDEMQKQADAALQRGDVEMADKQVAAMLAIDAQHAGALDLRKQIELLRLRSATPFPQLRSKFAKPISLEFRDAAIRVIFDVLSRSTGLNFIIDKDVRGDLRATLFVKQVPVEDAIDLLLTQSQLERKVVNDNTIIIYPNTPQKLKEYQDLLIRTFYLSNVEAKQAQALIKAMLKTRDIFIDEKLNTLTMRDTADAIRLAEKMLAAQDQAEPEVMIEIEVLEVSRKRILDLGIQWPSTFTALDQNLGAINLLNEIKGLRPGRIAVNRGPSAKINANDNDVNTLANPIIRVRNRDKARIHIGDKIPIVSATSTPSTQGPVITESITYLDVGLKIEVEPTVYLSDEVGMKITLEVSNSTPRGTTSNGSSLVEVSTRTATTSLRLKDGETQILAGLIRNDLNSSGDKVPGLGDIPGVGRLFGQTTDTMAKTELILSVKPRIVRNLPPMSPQQMEFASGTEGALKVGNVRPVGNYNPPAVTAPVATTTEAPSLPGAPSAEPAAAPSVPVSLSWAGDASLKLGEEATLNLMLASSEPVVSTALQIGYDPAVLKVVEATEGDVLKENGNTTFTTRLDEKAGRLFVGVSRIGGSATTGEGTLLSLKVQALAESAKSPVRIVVFSGVGPKNKLISVPLPAPADVSVTAP